MQIYLSEFASSLILLLFQKNIYVVALKKGRSRGCSADVKLHHFFIIILLSCLLSAACSNFMKQSFLLCVNVSAICNSEMLNTGMGNV